MLTKTEIEAIRIRCRNVKEYGIPGAHTAIAVYEYYISDIPALLAALADRDKPCECERVGFRHRNNRSYLLHSLGGGWFVRTVFEDDHCRGEAALIDIHYCPWCGHPLPEMEGVNNDES